MKFRLMTVVWGADYTKAFRDVCLQTLLSPANLPAFREVDAMYRIYTTEECLAPLRKSRSCKELATIMPVEFAVISGISYVGKYAALTQSNAHFIQEHAGQDDVAMIFISSDVVWADGALAGVRRIADAGKRLIAFATPRLSKETFLPALRNAFGTSDGRLRPVGCRELVRMSMDHLHPETVAQFWQGDRTRRTDGVFFWPVEGEGLLLRQAHQFPLMIRPGSAGILPNVALDSDYVARVPLEEDQIHVVEDSDDICAMDYTASAPQPAAPPAGGAIAEMADWVAVHTRARHRDFLRCRLRFHWKDCSERWREVERQSDVAIEDLLERIGGRDAPPRVVTASPMRYIRPTFLARKIREQGTGGVLRTAYDRVAHPILRRVHGPTIRIRMAYGSRHAGANR